MILLLQIYACEKDHIPKMDMLCEIPFPSVCTRLLEERGLGTRLHQVISAEESYAVSEYINGEMSFLFGTK